MYLAVGRWNKQSEKEQLWSQSGLKTQLGSQVAPQFSFWILFRLV